MESLRHLVNIAKRNVQMVILLIGTILLFSLLPKAVEGTTCSSRYSESYSVSSQRSYQCSYRQRYSTRCGTFGWKRCTRHRTAYNACYSQVYSTKYRYRIRYSCCTGWTGSDCSTAICSPTCQNGGMCSSPDQCSCRPGYIGNKCQTPVCSPSCQNGGTCVSAGRCSCRSGYTGSRCQTAICSPPCQNGGTCSSPGQCMCLNGYAGDECQTSICTPDCMNDGTCSSPGQCTCTTDWTGNKCQTPECSPTCQNGGTCSSPGRCTCTSNWSGNICQTPVCTPHCQNGGTCSSPGRCSCTSEWSEDRCETPVCLPQCQNGGTCSSPGQCTCRNEYTGDRCQTPICTPDCENGGTCSSPGQCVCPSVYRGSQCQTPICTPECQHGGICSNPGRCTCTADWEGARCQEPVCSPTCGNGGTCLSPWICGCAWGYVGSACEEAVVISCPADLTLPTAEGVNYTFVNWSDPEPQGGAGLVYTNSTHRSGMTFFLGNTTVMYEVYTADQRKIAQCDFIIDVIDIEPPKMTCPNDTNIFTGPQNFTVVTWDEPIPTDNSGYVSMTSSHYSGDVFIGVDTVVLYQAKDLSNNVNNCRFTVQVEVVNITCPNTIHIPIDKAIGRSQIFWELPTLTVGNERVAVTSPENPDLKGNIYSTESSDRLTSEIGDRDIYATEYTDRLSIVGDAIAITSKSSEEPVMITSDPNFIESKYVSPLASDDVNSMTITPVSDIDGHIHTDSGTEASGNTNDVTSELVDYETELFTDLVTFAYEDKYYTEYDPLSGDRSRTLARLDEETTTSSGDERKLLSTTIQNNPDFYWSSSETDSSVKIEYVLLDPTIPEDERLEVIASHISGDVFGVGATEVGYSVFESGSDKLITNCSFDVEVLAVHIKCPADIHKPIDASMLSTTVSWISPNVTGGDEVVTLSSNHLPEDQFPVGSTRVTYNVVDVDNHLVTKCYFNVNVYAVSLICPRDILLSTEPSRDSTHVHWSPARAVGNKDLISISSTYSTGDYFPIGLTVVEYEARSVLDNQTVTICRFGVSVLDTEIPFIACPPDILIFTDVSIEPNVTWEAVNASDNSGNVSMDCTHTSGDEFSVSQQEVVCSAWDPYGNQNRCSFLVHIEGVQILCPGNVTTSIDKESTVATVAWDHPKVIGGMNRTEHTVNRIPGDEFPVGLTIVEYLVYAPDSHLITSCNFTITVYDPDIPTLSCPDDVSVLTEDDKPKQVFWELPEIFDFSGTAYFTYQSHEPGMIFNVGSMSIEYAATDFMGKTGRCTFTVEVIGVRIVCPRNVHTVTDSRSAFANVTWNAPEVIGGEGYENINASGELWQEFPIGHSKIIYDVSDDDGTVVTNCTFEVHVEDQEAPVINCPADIVIPVESHNTPTVKWNMPYVKDNSGVISIINSSHNSGAIYPVGTTNVIYSAEDGFGNINECSFKVVVQEVSMDCPLDVNVTSSEGLSFRANVTWPQPIIHGYDGELQLLSTRSIENMFPIGKHEVTYEAYKGLNFITKCSFSVIVHDEEKPVVMCPKDELVLVEPGKTPTVDWNKPYVNDNSGDVKSIISSMKPGDRFGTGSTTVYYTVMDGSGNINGCTFRVVIQEVSIDCPSDFSVTTDTGSAFAANVTWPQPTFHGYNEKLHITSNRPLYDSFSVGDHMLIWTAFKGSKFSTKCNFTLSVYDREPPSIQCPGNTLLQMYTGSTSTPVRWDSAVTNDNSGQDVRLIVSHASGDRFYVGSTMVTYTAIDASGNMATCEFNITVKAICSEDVSFVDNIGNLTWLESERGSVVKSNKRCPIDSSNRHESIATRQCISHNILGAAWSPPQLTDCGDRVELNLDKLAGIPVELSNVVEVAVALDNLTADLQALTSRDLINVQSTLTNIIEEEATLPQIALALVNTTRHILSSDHLRPCPRNNETVMSTDTLLHILKSVDFQMTVSSQEFLVKMDDVFFASEVISMETTVEDSRTVIMTQISKTNDVKVHVQMKETCSEQLVGNEATPKATLAVYGQNSGRQITTDSLMKEKLVIVSPLVSMVLTNDECWDTNVEIPFNVTHGKEQRTFQGKEVRCIVLAESDKSETGTSHCETLMVKDNSITCDCSRTGVFVVVAEYECWSQITWAYYANISFYVAIAGIFFSIMLILIGAIVTKGKTPIDRNILFLFLVFLCCFYVSLLALDHVRSLPFGCIAFKACVQYFTIATLLWTAIEAQTIYTLMRNPDTTCRFSMVAACILTCFLPIIPVGLDVWLRIDDLENDKICMILLDLPTYLTLLLPVSLIAFHNTLMYLVIAFRLVQSREPITDKRLSFVFGEALFLFVMVVGVMTSAYCFLLTRADIYQMVLFVSSVVLVVFILIASCLRLFSSVQRSATYDVHQANEIDASSKSKHAVYFSPFTEVEDPEHKTQETKFVSSNRRIIKGETTDNSADNNGNVVVNDEAADIEYICPQANDLDLAEVKRAQEEADIEQTKYN